MQGSTPLDYEQHRSHNITVTAADSGDPKLSTSINIILFVTDLNDEVPVFEKASYSATRTENSRENEVMFLIQAIGESSLPAPG